MLETKGLQTEILHNFNQGSHCVSRIAYYPVLMIMLYRSSTLHACIAYYCMYTCMYLRVCMYLCRLINVCHCMYVYKSGVKTINLEFWQVGLIATKGCLMAGTENTMKFSQNISVFRPHQGPISYKSTIISSRKMLVFLHQYFICNYLIDVQ